MDTPKYSNLSGVDFDHVYEPAEDSFLLLDALEQELPELLNKHPTVCVEIGTGSGIIISAIAKHLNYQAHGFFAVDINSHACNATRETSIENEVNVEVINMDLLTAFKDNSIDLLIFNPPYVPTETPSSKCTKYLPEKDKFYDIDSEKVFKKENNEKMLIKSWAGGEDSGCEVMNRVLNNLNKILAPGGVFYLLIIKDNNPEKIKANLTKIGFITEQIIDRKIRGEHLIVLKIFKDLFKVSQ